MDQKNIKFIAAIMAGFVVLVVVVWLSGHSLKQDMALEMSKQISEQNDKISGLKTQFSQLETSLRGLKNITETTIIQHGEQIEKLAPQLGTSLKGDIAALADEQNNKLLGLEAKLQTLEEKAVASNQQRREQMEELSRKATQLNTQLNTVLKSSITGLVDEQSDRLNGLESQLQALKEEVATSVKQYHSQIDKLECKIKKLDKTLLSLKEKMAILDDQQHNLKDEFGHISTQ